MTANARVLYERLVAENIVPRPWNMDEFRRRADEFRGRSVHLVNQPAEFWSDGAGFCGLYAMTFAAGDVDIMIIRSDGSPEWRDQCIGHEYGHLLLNHDPRGMISDAQIRRLFGDDLFTDPASVRDLLRIHTRADMSIPIERQAEMFAELLAFTPGYVDRIESTTPECGTGLPCRRGEPGRQSASVLRRQRSSESRRESDAGFCERGDCRRHRGAMGRAVCSVRDSPGTATS